MFGYVNICAGCISEEDKKLYGSYYCGLCKEIGKKSQMLRMGLSNDLTFLAILLSGVTEKTPEILENKACVLHHIKKHSEIKSDMILEYAADMNILMTYFKLCDDINDDKKLSSILIKPVFSKKIRDIGKKYDKKVLTIEEKLKKLYTLEKEKCSDIDRVSDCFAKILEELFSPEFISDNETIRILKWMGYNVGRWIYMIDAYNDIEKDKKSNSYNPFLCMDSINTKLVYESLTYTLNNIANAYDLLKIYRNDSLIRNILYQGLSHKQDSVFKLTEEKDESI